MKKLLADTTHKLDEAGASTILVIFMLIVLITLGAFAITSASVNRNFSKKALAWSESYFSLDERAEYFLMDADALLAEAENQSIDYIINRGFSQQAYKGLPETLQQEIYQAYSTPENKDDITAIIRKVYPEFALEMLASLTNSYGAEVTRTSEGLLINHSVVSESDPNVRIIIALEPIAPDYFEITFSRDKISFVKDAPAKRYKIIQWRQSQEQMYSDEVLFENLMD
jgi:hypothetical protein